MKQHSKVAVVGTSLSGLTTAVALAKQGIDVTLIGPNQPLPPIQVDVYDPRVYAISPNNQAFLSQLGVWGLIPEDRQAPVDRMCVMGHAPSTHSSTQFAVQPVKTGNIDLNAWQGAEPELAWIMESREIERALRQAVSLMGITWLNSHLSSYHDHHEDGLSLLLEDGRTLDVDLLVGADGGRSKVRSLAGITMTRQPYDHVGIVCHLNAQSSHAHCARQWFTPDGILALLPMPNTSQGAQVSMVWSMLTSQANELLALSSDEQATVLSDRLRRATGGALGELTVRSSLFGFPLGLQTTSSMIKPKVALVGDAAHIVHPLAGQGLNLGLGDIIELAHVLSTRHHYQKIGDFALLRRFERARAEPIMRMRMTTDALYHLFYSQHHLMVHLRNIGLSAVNRLGCVKKQLITQAR